MRKNPMFLLTIFIIMNLMFMIQSHLSQAATSEKRVALVIGNSAYQNTPPLANPRNDATEIGKVLKRVGFDVDVVLDATKTEMDQALRRFGNNLDGSSAAVFFYAGHGIQVDGNNYILPVDTALKNERDLHWDSCDLTTVLKKMEGNNRVNLLFLDACRDNPLSQTLARGMGASRSSSIGRGLAPMKANAGTLIAYSTKEGEVAADGQGKHSPFTEALLKHIEMPGVEIGLMLRKVREAVITTTKNKQVPWEYGSLLGEFYFTGPVTIQVQPKEDTTSAGSKTETLYWESIMNSTNPAVFEAYLKKYPKGEFSEIAQIKIADLKKDSVKSGQATVVDSLPGIPAKTSDSLKPAVETNKPPLQQPRTGTITQIAEQKSPEIHLTVAATPPDSRIKILNNQGKYQKGMILKPGKYQVEVFRDGYEKFTQWITMDQNDMVLPVALTPLQKGSMRVTSDPAGAAVYVDSKKVGGTPIEIPELPAGQKTVEIQKDCFEPTSRTVTVSGGQQAVVAVQLTAKCGSLHITGEPLGADVYLDEKRAGSLPADISDVSTGNHQIVVKKDGYPDYEETVAVQAGKTTSVTTSVKPPSKYSKMDSSGKQLPNSAKSWMMVRDNETGLIWEVKQKNDGVKNYDNPSDADNTYTWDESSQKFINALNAAHFGGFSDWRLPSLVELKTIVDSKRTRPSINTGYFPNTQSSFYWSSTTHDSRSYDAWGAFFDLGYYVYNFKSLYFHARAVRGGNTGR